MTVAPIASEMSLVGTHTQARVYFAKCQSCGDEGPEAASEADARALAIEELWTVNETICKCPDCMWALL